MNVILFLPVKFVIRIKLRPKWNFVLFVWVACRLFSCFLVRRLLAVLYVIAAEFGTKMSLILILFYSIVVSEAQLLQTTVKSLSFLTELLLITLNRRYNFTTVLCDKPVFRITV